MHETSAIIGQFNGGSSIRWPDPIILSAMQKTVQILQYELQMNYAITPWLIQEAF